VFRDPWGHCYETLYFRNLRSYEATVFVPGKPYNPSLTNIRLLRKFLYYGQKMFNNNWPWPWPAPAAQRQNTQPNILRSRGRIQPHPLALGESKMTKNCVPWSLCKQSLKGYILTRTYRIIMIPHVNTT